MRHMNSTPHHLALPCPALPAHPASPRTQNFVLIALVILGDHSSESDPSSAPSGAAIKGALGSGMLSIACPLPLGRTKYKIAHMCAASTGTLTAFPGKPLEVRRRNVMVQWPYECQTCHAMSSHGGIANLECASLGASTAQFH